MESIFEKNKESDGHYSSPFENGFITPPKRTKISRDPAVDPKEDQKDEESIDYYYSSENAENEESEKSD